MTFLDSSDSLSPMLWLTTLPSPLRPVGWGISPPETACDALCGAVWRERCWSAVLYVSAFALSEVEREGETDGAVWSAIARFEGEREGEKVSE
jgi:hypothetical protein